MVSNQCIQRLRSPSIAVRPNHKMEMVRHETIKRSPASATAPTSQSLRRERRRSPRFWERPRRERCPDSKRGRMDFPGKPGSCGAWSHLRVLRTYSRDHPKHPNAVKIPQCPEWHELKRKIFPVLTLRLYHPAILNNRIDICNWLL